MAKKDRYLTRLGAHRISGRDGGIGEAYRRGLGTRKVTRSIPRVFNANQQRGRIREDIFRYEDLPRYHVKEPGARKGQEGQTNYISIRRTKKRVNRGSARVKSSYPINKSRVRKWADKPSAFGSIFY